MTHGGEVVNTRVRTELGLPPLAEADAEPVDAPASAETTPEEPTRAETTPADDASSES